jgi:MFS family permease
MTSLTPDPLIVSLVQVATSLPMFLFALPAGALADIVDRRKFLALAESSITLISGIFTLLIWLDLVTPLNLLIFTFLIGLGGALAAPAWQAVVPQLVPREALSPAVTANSVGFNISRAIGPALGGAITAWLGMVMPFLINTVSNLGVIGALLWWRPSRERNRLPAERFGRAIRTGFRHAVSNPHLRATLLRSVGFFLFGSAYWALLPLIARSRIAGGPELYGLLLGAIGFGAVGGAFLLPRLQRRLGPDRLVAAGTFGTALALAVFALARHPGLGLLASFIAGVSWIAVLSCLNVSAQIALPDWVRGRGLAMFVTILYGALALGSVVWGEVAGVAGLPVTLFIAAAGAVVSIPLTWRWKLQTGAGLDLTPSLHWPAPIAAHEVEGDRGPVLVTVEYRIDPADRELFLEALDKLAYERRRDGAYEWEVFEDIAEEGRFLETFFVESWLEHLRQHERVTNADRIIQTEVQRYHREGAPKVTHYVAPGPGNRTRDKPGR